MTPACTLFYDSTAIKERCLCDLEKLFRHLVAGLFNHFGEVAFGVYEEFVGVIELNEPAGVHHHHAVRVHDGVESMRHRQHRAVRESLSYGSLDELVRSEKKKIHVNFI